MADEEKDVTMVEGEPEQSEELRDVLEAAFDEPEEAQAEAAASGEEPTEEPASAEAGDTAPGDSGTETQAGAEPAAAEAAKPPIDWDAGLREQWGELPDGVRKKIADREQQMAQTMQGTAQARQIAQQVGNIANQFGSVMAAEGVQNPLQMFQGVMQTVAELRMGSPQQKAQKMAQLFNTYGVDLKELDRALSSQISGKPAEGAAPSVDPGLEQLLDQRLAPVNQFLQQQQHYQQQQQLAGQQSAQAEVNEFAANGGEFLNDVRHDVADLMDLATRQGREMSLQEAYDKACAMNPQIAGVLAQRKEQEALTQANQNVSRKRAAASSLGPANLGGNSGANNESLSGALNAAWDEQIGR